MAFSIDQIRIIDPPLSPCKKEGMGGSLFIAELNSYE